VIAYHGPRFSWYPESHLYLPGQNFGCDVFRIFPFIPDIPVFAIPEYSGIFWPGIFTKSQIYYILYLL
jgi:hypothetical protein